MVKMAIANCMVLSSASTSLDMAEDQPASLIPAGRWRRRSEADRGGQPDPAA
jgi:hypothetical protein